MRITVNGQSQDIADNCSVHALLVELRLQDQRIAVEVNQEIVPRAQHETYRLAAYDQVEIVHAVGGG